MNIGRKLSTWTHKFIVNQAISIICFTNEKKTGQRELPNLKSQFGRDKG